jgi:hypothetical protein
MDRTNPIGSWIQRWERVAVLRRVFYDIVHLRKSARPLILAELDAELKAELAARDAKFRPSPDLP